MTNSTKLPERLGPIHFTGIGGIGMSGIAEVLVNLGYTVQGSDLSASMLIERLAEMGVRVFERQEAGNVSDAAVVVISSAIKKGNPELMEARRLGLPVVRRAEMLAELMRLRSNVAVAGTHGKTTTTTLIATLLENGGFDPTVVNGGVIHAYGSTTRKGEGDWMVVEADESDGTFVKLPATIAVVTNIDPEHLDHYGDFENLKKAFDSFVANVPFYGFAVCCIDHPEVQSLIGRISDRRIVTFGFNAQADVGASNLQYSNGRACFDILMRKEGKTVHGCTLPMPGIYNISNALASVAVARELGMKIRDIRNGLANFRGVNRRFTRVGTVNGIEIIDDYAHHPVEIDAALKAARQVTSGQILAIHQPHRFTRLNSLFDDFCTCFSNADHVAVADVYDAGECPIAGADRDSLVSALTQHGHRNAVAISGPSGMATFVAENAQPGDLVACLGAGSISAWAHSLPDRLRNLDRKHGDD